MKLLLFVMLLTTASYAAKLDHTYLPPSGAHNSGGSSGALQTPVFTAPFNGPALSETFDNYSQAPTSLGGASPNSASVSPANSFTTIPLGNSNSVSPAPSPFVYNAPSNGPTQTYGVPAKLQVITARPQADQERNSAIIHQHNDISADGFSYAFETENGISAEENGVATNGVQAQGGFSYMGDDGNKYSITYTADENGYRPQGEHLPTSPPIPDVILRSLETIARAKANGISYEDGENDNKQNDKLVQQYHTPIQNYGATSHSNNGPVEQTNNPAYQTSLPVNGLNTRTQQYGADAQPNNFFVQDYNTPSSMYKSAEFNDRHHVNNAPAQQTAHTQQFSSSPDLQFSSPTQSQNIAYKQNDPSSQHRSGPYNYNAPSKQYSETAQSNGIAPQHYGLQSQRFIVPDQKYGTSTQSYNGPARGDNQGVRRDSTPNNIYAMPSGPVQSYNEASQHNSSPDQAPSRAQRPNSSSQQFPVQAQSINGPVYNPAQVQRYSTATQLNGAPTNPNYEPTRFNNAGSQQTKAPAHHFNTPTQQYNGNQRPAQQYNNHAPTPVQHFSTSSPQYGALGQSNNGPIRPDSGYHQKNAPTYQTSSQVNRYSAPNQQYDTYPQSENRPAYQQNGLASIPQATRDQFGATRAPASFSPETGYKY